MKQRIGIITFHRSYNYGSALQAYALQTLLCKREDSVKIIDYVLMHDFRQYKLFRTSCYKDHYKSIFADILYFLPNLRRKRAFEEFVKKYLQLTKKRYYEVEKMTELNKEFDVFIAGSDQIWNFECTNGVNPAFFLQFADFDKVKIAYAPSIAHLSFEKNYDTILKKYLQTFNCLSVREESTIKQIEDLVNKKIYSVLDPTLLLDKKEYDKIIKYNNKMSKHYIFVYILEENDRILEYVKTIAKEKDCSVIYISKKKKWFGVKAVNVYGCSPNEFLGYIKHARYIVTNSFHATVFSILFHKQFATFLTQHSGSRMQDLLTNINLQARIVNGEGVEFNIDGKIDYDVVDKCLITLKKDSQNYLWGALDG